MATEISKVPHELGYFLSANETTVNKKMFTCVSFISIHISCSLWETFESCVRFSFQLFVSFFSVSIFKCLIWFDSRAFVYLTHKKNPASKQNSNSLLLRDRCISMCSVVSLAVPIVKWQHDLWSLIKWRCLLKRFKCMIDRLPLAINALGFEANAFFLNPTIDGLWLEF